MPTSNAVIPTNMNSQLMLDNFKSMILTMAMVRGSNNSESSNSFVNTILIMLIVSFIDTIVIQLKKLFGIVSSKIENYVSQKTSDISLLNKIMPTNISKTKKASIIIKVEQGSKNPTSDAIIDLLTHLPHTKCILMSNGNYTINYSEEIEISKGLYAQLVSCSGSQMVTEVNINEDTNEENKTTSSKQSSMNVPVDKENGESGAKFPFIDIYSYTMDMELLRNEINNIIKNYLIKMTNKLGNNIYYFSELPTVVYRDGNGKIDHSKLNECIHFTMKPFVTNRSFKNLFGKSIDVIRKRVEFFRDNKDWYDEKGVPYTLGILVSGNPGSGKTSVIKCIANELKRHIINIHLTDTMTKTQIENLFYNEQIQVTQNGKTDTYTIPINKRIYVLEDVDCQCDVILDRENETAEDILARKNAELTQEIEQLKYALNEMSNGRKLVMTGGKMPNIDLKKDEISNQKITLSFLLNLFDGVLETPGRITFMTTNFVNKLDKAFTRPGRIDVISKFGFADHSQLIAIIEHRYDTKLTEEQINIINNIHPCITPAEVSRILFENFDNLQGALEGLINYVDEYKKNEETKKAQEKEVEMKVAVLEAEATKENDLSQTKTQIINKNNNSEPISSSIEFKPETQNNNAKLNYQEQTLMKNNNNCEVPAKKHKLIDSSLPVQFNVTNKNFIASGEVKSKQFVEERLKTLDNMVATQNWLATGEYKPNNTTHRYNRQPMINIMDYSEPCNFASIENN